MANDGDSGYGSGSTFLGLSVRGSRACLHGGRREQRCSENNGVVNRRREDGSDDDDRDGGDDGGGGDDGPQRCLQYLVLRYRDDAWVPALRGHQWLREGRWQRWRTM